ncbi:MAG: Gfo/Idh/MocA family protein [Salinispira sp.]
MPDPVRWGIVAPGHIAEQFASAMTVVKDSELLALASRSKKRAREFSRKFSIPRIHETYEDLAEDPDIDAVYVASPHPFHAEQTILCLRNNTAVLCEKPLAVNAGQARMIIDSARKHNTFFMEAMWTRFLPIMKAVRSHGDEIGEIQRVQADFSYSVDFSDEHRCMNPELAGGSLLDVGVYVLNFARMFTKDWPEESFSAVHMSRTGVDLQAVMIQRYRSGALAQLSCGIQVPGPCTASIYGSRGTIEFPRGFHAAQSAVIRNDMGERVIKKPFLKNGFEYEIEEVNACIRKGQLESAGMPWSESLRIVEHMDALRAQWGLQYPFE